MQVLYHQLQELAPCRMEVFHLNNYVECAYYSENHKILRIGYYHLQISKFVYAFNKFVCGWEGGSVERTFVFRPYRTYTQVWSFCNYMQHGRFELRKTFYWNLEIELTSRWDLILRPVLYVEFPSNAIQAIDNETYSLLAWATTNNEKFVIHRGSG